MRCSAGQVHVTLRSKSALLRLGTQSRPKDVQSLPFTSSPYTSATRKTCRITLPTGTPAEGGHIHNTRLDSWKISRARARASVFSTHLLSRTVPYVMPGFTRDWLWAHLAACVSRDETSPGPAMCAMELLSRYIKPKVGAYAYWRRRGTYCFCKFWKLQIVAGRRIEKCVHLHLSRNEICGADVTWLCFRRVTSHEIKSLQIQRGRQLRY